MDQEGISGTWIKFIDSIFHNTEKENDACVFKLILVQLVKHFCIFYVIVSFFIPVSIIIKLILNLWFFLKFFASGN